METQTSDIFTELREVALRPAGGGDRAAVDKACERMDRRREESRKKLGEVRLTSDLIREVRQP